MRRAKSPIPLAALPASNSTAMRGVEDGDENGFFAVPGAEEDDEGSVEMILKCAFRAAMTWVKVLVPAPESAATAMWYGASHAADEDDDEATDVADKRQESSRNMAKRRGISGSGASSAADGGNSASKGAGKSA